MKRILSIIIFALLLGFNSLAQDKDTWIAFWNEDSTLIGFKNKAGQIKIAPKFNNFTTAGRFDNIIGVAEKNRQGTYYLTKKGRIVGKDSLYIFDNGADCESEGFIRFRDKMTHKVGIFNSNGDIVIPADYDNLMPVRNGTIVALKGGHLDASQQSEHNEFPWVGSRGMLIDTHNKVLIKDFRYDENINFFSMVISKQAIKSPIRQNFKANDGKYYSFINFDKEFNAWLKDSLLNNLTKRNLLKYSYKNITRWDKKKGWIKETKQNFMDKNFEMISSKLAQLNLLNYDYQIFTEGLDNYIYSAKEFERYFDNCGAAKEWIYPVKNIVITHNIDKDIIQDQFHFFKDSEWVQANRSIYQNKQ